MSYIRGLSGSSDVRSPTSTSTEVRSPTSTSTEVRSPTSTSTEVRSPTSTSTDAYTAGNVTVTGGAGAGAYTNVNIYGPPKPRTPASRLEHARWRAGRLAPAIRATPDGYYAQDVSALTTRPMATDMEHPDISPSLVPRATDRPDLSAATSRPSATGEYIAGVPDVALYAGIGIGAWLLYRHMSKRGRR